MYDYMLKKLTEKISSTSYYDQPTRKVMYIMEEGLNLIIDSVKPKSMPL